MAAAFTEVLLEPVCKYTGTAQRRFNCVVYIWIGVSWLCRNQQYKGKETGEKNTVRIVLVSYGIQEYDGRLKELVKLASYLGELRLLCCSATKQDGLYYVDQKMYLRKRTYYGYLKYVLRACKGERADILLVDNLFAALPALLTRRKLRASFTIQDVRELYLFRKSHGTGKFFTFFERKLMRKADVVLAANQERAEIMHRENQLKRMPLVFENIRFLEGEEDETAYAEKYKGVFHYRFNIVSTSGLFMERDSDKLILAMKELPKDFGLFFVGKSSEKDLVTCRDILNKEQISNVHVLGRVPMSELKYIVRQCQIGAVHYHKRDDNNMYCASGKIFEFLHEGLPIVTTENPPLKNFCDATGTGIADDSFFKGIMKLADNYARYQERVEEYIKTISPDKYNQDKAKEISIALGLQ